jgi:predicted histone-like DNA-binding protein
MAKRITAIATYTPRVELSRRATLDEVARYIEGQSSFTTGEVKAVLISLKNALTFYMSSGTPVKLDGLGTFSPTIGLSGKLNVGVRVDNELIKELNGTKFAGKIKNKRMIKKKTDDLVKRWNNEHPDDPVE